MSKENLEKEYSELGFSNKFMFGKIMRDERRAKPFLEEILGFPIHHIEYIEREKDVDVNVDSHGIRTDIYVDDGHTIYDCEMQTQNKGDLRKRSRYYQGQIDTYNLDPGEDYNLLKKTYVIFICTFDLFGEERYIYTFESRCEQNPDLKLGDESVKVFVNTKGTVGDVSDTFKELLHFIDTSEIRDYDSELVNDLKDALVDARKRTDWRGYYMTMKEYLTEATREARAEAITEGRAEGREQGRAEGKAEALDRYVKRSIKNGVDRGIIISDIMEDYDLSREAAEEKVRKCCV